MPVKAVYSPENLKSHKSNCKHVSDTTTF